MKLIYEYRLRFLLAACILIFMGAMLKINHYENGDNSFIGGIANMIVYILLQVFGEKRFAKTANN
jgi:hypothetical protein